MYVYVVTQGWKWVNNIDPHDNDSLTQNASECDPDNEWPENDIDFLIM